MNLNLKKPNGAGYRVRMFGRLWPDTPEMDQVVGTESEEWLAHLAEVWPDRIYYVTEEGLA